MAKTVSTLCMLALLAITASAEETPASIALLVNESNADVVASRVGPALAAKDAVTRAAASRVALVRGLTSVLPQIREALTIESHPDAAREEARALVILGEPADIDRARAATRKLPAAIDDVIAHAVARRPDAFEIYVTTLRTQGFTPDAGFFTQALWRRPAAAVAAGSRLLGMRDAAGWQALLAALSDSHLAMQPGVLGVSLNASPEEIRTASVWYLVLAYLPDPSMIDGNVRAVLGAPTEEASTREAFGRELLRRMLGAEKKDDPRWLEWLQTAEADPLLGTDESLFQYFTEKEFLARKNHCGIASYDCRMPQHRPARTIPSTNVAEPSFFLPEVLPPGVAGAVIAETRCNAWWLALAGATSDTAGRVQSVNIKRIQMDSACEKAVTTLMRLSLATSGSIDAPLTTGNILLVHSRKQQPCLDEAPLDAPMFSTPRQVGGEVTAPVVKHRQEPEFPASARRAMGGGTNVIIIVRCVISRDGCVRAIQLIKQSPFPELNSAALTAISQWTFEPGRYRGNPVDVVFNLTVNFMTGR
ncbi:MAG: energy transducer TonB [Acidobacteriota bacterium]|nr:energy transducer TonB [Acidobacteriota bacterium]